MSLPDVVSREQWLAARRNLLAKEKELTQARDALSAQRRWLPMVLVEKDYRFGGPDGEVGLADLFEGRHQLIVGHFQDRGLPPATGMEDAVVLVIRQRLQLRLSCDAR